MNRQSKQVSVCNLAVSNEKRSRNRFAAPVEIVWPEMVLIGLRHLPQESKGLERIHSPIDEPRV